MNAESQFSFADYRLDLQQRMLFRGVEAVPLTPKSFDLLVLLVSNCGRVVSKDEILEKVWGRTVVEDGTITWHLHALRQALANGDEAARFIDTVPKRGYRFVAPTTPVTERRRQVEAQLETTIAKAPQVARTSRRAWWLAGGGLALMLFGAAFVLWRITPTEPALPYANRDWLLVTNFENQTGEPRFDRALLTALTVSLEQSTFANVFPRSRVATTLERMRKSPESPIDELLAREICLREGLRALVTPSITRTGKQYAVAARLMDPQTGNTVRAYLIRAEDENRILAAVQELATQLRRDLGESIGQVTNSNRPLEQVTTPVLAALQQYSEGMENSARGRIGDATREFEAAVDSDPEFAMAYAALGKIKYSSSVQRPDLGNEYFQRALALSTRTTDRERQLIAAEFAASRGQVEEALNLYRGYAAAYPDDLRMHSRMGDLLAAAARFRGAIEAFEAALTIDPDDPRANYSLGAAYASEGEFGKARRYIERAIELEPTLTNRGAFGSTYGAVLFGGGDRAAALDFFARQQADRGRRYRAERSLGLIDMHDGKYRRAGAHFQAAIDAPNVTTDVNLARSRNHGYLAAVLSARGDRQAALRELDLGVASLDTHGPAPAEFRARFATAYARLGNLSAAEQQLERVIAGADALRPRDRALVQLVQGEIALAKGEPARAIKLLREAQSEIGIDLPLLLETLARATEASGNRAAAIEAWRDLIALRGRWIFWEAQEGWLLGHLRLAKLYHAQSDDAAAAAVLEPLLANWQAADPDFRPAMEARRLRKELKTPAALAQTRPPGG